MKQVKVAILGMGTVGTGVYKVIENEAAYIAHKNDVDLSVKKVLSLKYGYDVPQEKRVSSLDDIINDEEISIVVEVMGGIQPALTFITKCLEAGKTVVSANKQLIANHWAEIEQTAKKSGAGFY
ncbi:MAG: homoserine dehydrogenase, partial [Christensenellaceae bacterium]|nr:homoserine dehydrogenase [Christensenellaceae bacterium]